MNRTHVTSSLILVASAVALHADVSIEERGAWPSAWPEQLDAFRETSRTIEGPLAEMLQYQIGFKSQKDFENAWPHLLKVRTAEHPITLVRGPYVGTGAMKGTSVKAGVLVNSFPSGKGERQVAIVLVVDGDIVDLNRIKFPAKTNIQDERFKQRSKPRRRPRSQTDSAEDPEG